MPYSCSFECCGVKFDIYDSDRVPVESPSYDYYITPSGFSKIEAWMSSKFIRKIETKQQMDFVIQNKWIRRYGE